MPSAPKKAASGPGYYDLIKEAVISLGERTGSSRQAIDKYVSAKKGSSYSKSRLNIALKKGVESGKLLQVKGSFKLAPTEKKAKKAAVPKKKAAGAKKTTKKPAAKKAPGAKKVLKKPAAGAKKTKTTKPKKVSAKKTGATKKKAVKKSGAKKTAPKKTA